MRVIKTGEDWPADGLTTAAEYLIVKSRIFASTSLTAAERDALLAALENGELQASWHGDGIAWTRVDKRDRYPDNCP
jgi:hypothetical protein